MRCNLLVQQGTLHVQDPIVVGNTFGRVRAMTNDLGRRIKTAAPSTPVFNYWFERSAYGG